ncbi:ATP-binding cassette, subfamily C, bacterial [Methylomarinovum caldicuralii]|uniref:ATP-binding cassette, subfamily C, bacterial n=1 Tax=Methylomarinovum caldicuralii TaxID=438856 RepID=A0AAU9C4R5_9GAMM|nr:ABC transporter ATP-binding protein [Methylomarinovum caldicuralii]BCX82738.1 ATP-binding cassette, subfamily C, bacterial [Methylomarinovum caldicuralii]
MLDSLRKLFALLNATERFGFMALVGIMLFEAVLEIASLYLVPAYVGLLAYPERVARYLPPQFAHLERMDALLWASAVVVGFFSLKLLINTGATWIKTRYAQNRALRFSQRLYAGYLKAPYEYHLRHNSAQLQRNLNNESIQLAERVLVPLLEMATQGVIIAAVLTAFLFYIPYRPLALLLGCLGFAAWVVWRQQRKVRAAGRQAQVLRGRLVQHVNEGLGCVKEIKLLGREDHFLRRFHDDFAALMQQERYARVLALKFIPGWVELATIFALAGMVLLLFRQGNSAGQVLQIVTVCAVGLARLKGALSGFMSQYSQMQHYRAALDVIHRDIQALESQPQVQVEKAPSRFTFQALELKNVHYRYPGAAADTLKGINLTIHKGEAIGFVGKTGAGKSTLIDVILGLLVPREGEILLNGGPLQPQLRDWQRRIGYVPQMLSLVDGTLRENIALGIEGEHIDEIALKRAVKQAQLQELVDRLPDGLDTVIGERGIRLSGGQRQRVAIARALYHDPEVLVLDEGTSALDVETEREVIRAVENLRGQVTILMIAHRLMTLDKCDRRIVLEEGGIAREVNERCIA